MSQVTGRVNDAEVSGRLAYPSVPLGVALQINRQIMNECKRDYIDGTINNEKIAQILKQKPTSGSFKGKVYALNKYGLIIREGRLNRVTALGQRLAEQALSQDTFEAFRSYAPFDELYRHLPKNHVIKISALEEEVARRHRFGNEKTKEFSRIFMKSLEVTGRLERIEDTGICIHLDEEDPTKIDAGAALDSLVHKAAELSTNQDALAMESPSRSSIMSEEGTCLPVADVPVGAIRLIIKKGASFDDVLKTLVRLNQLAGDLKNGNSDEHVQ